MQKTHCDYPNCKFQTSGSLAGGQMGTSKISVSLSPGYHVVKHFDLCPEHMKAIGLSLDSYQDVGAELLERLVEFVREEIDL